MSGRVDAVLEVLRRVIVEPIGRLGLALGALGAALLRFRWRFAVIAVLALIGYGLYQCPPFASVSGGEVLVRSNDLDGTSTAYTAGTVLALPGIHQVRRYSIRDQVYRLTEGASATGPAPVPIHGGSVDWRRPDRALGHRPPARRPAVEGLSR